MQSSTAIAFRALIMLVFLISVPLVAIFGKDLPEVIKGFMDGRLSVQVTEQPKPAGEAIVTAPPPPVSGQPTPPSNPFSEPAPYRAAPLAAGQPTPMSPAPIQPPNLTPPGGFPNAAVPPAAVPSGVTPTSNLAPTNGGQVPLAAATYPGGNALMNGQPNPAGDWPSPPPMQTPPDAFQAPADSKPIANTPPPSQAGVADGIAGGAPTQTSDDKFRHAETRLRELGATQYMLETWGPQNEQYRFTCRMAIGPNVGVSQHFEAVKGDPWQAMQDVLRQVEDWQKQTVQ